MREEVYKQPPPGYSVPEGMVCHLRCSLYGLKQATRAWFQRFVIVITAAGFSASAHDPALFVHTSSRGQTLLPLYVDDMIITGDDPQYIAFVKARLSEQFLMSDLGSLRYFLGIEVSSSPEGFYLSQEKYIQDLLDRTFRIFLIGLLLLTIGLLRLLWSLMFIFVPQMVNLLRILLDIVTLLGV